MALTSDLTVFGDLTGSGTQDTVFTATGTCYVTAKFFNRNASARTLSVWVNSASNPNYVLNGASLSQNYSLEIEMKMGSGDSILAEASAATSIACIIEVDNLS